MIELMDKEQKVSEKTHVHEYKEISINSVSTINIGDKNNIIVDDIFASTVAFEITRKDEDHEPQTIDECRCRHNWPKWKEVIQAELDSLEKYKVLKPVVQTPENIKPIGYK